MSGASALERAFETVGPTSSIMTCWRVPTLRFSLRAEIFCCRAISAFQRSCLISSGTGLPIAFELAPATGSYLKQPRRSISASSQHACGLRAESTDFALPDPGEQIGEVGIGLAGKADDEGRAQRKLRALLAPFPDPRQRL